MNLVLRKDLAFAVLKTVYLSREKKEHRQMMPIFSLP